MQPKKTELESTRNEGPSSISEALKNKKSLSFIETSGYWLSDEDIREATASINELSSDSFFVHYGIKDEQTFLAAAKKNCVEEFTNNKNLVACFVPILCKKNGKDHWKLTIYRNSNADFTEFDPVADGMCGDYVIEKIYKTVSESKCVNSIDLMYPTTTNFNDKNASTGKDARKATIKLIEGYLNKQKKNLSYCSNDEKTNKKELNTNNKVISEINDDNKISFDDANKPREEKLSKKIEVVKDTLDKQTASTDNKPDVLHQRISNSKQEKESVESLNVKEKKVVKKWTLPTLTSWEYIVNKKANELLDALQADNISNDEKKSQWKAFTDKVDTLESEYKQDEDAKKRKFLENKDKGIFFTSDNRCADDLNQDEKINYESPSLIS